MVVEFNLGVVVDHPKVRPDRFPSDFKDGLDRRRNRAADLIQRVVGKKIDKMLVPCKTSVVSVRRCRSEPNLIPHVDLLKRATNERIGSGTECESNDRGSAAGSAPKPSASFNIFLMTSCWLREAPIA